MIPRTIQRVKKSALSARASLNLSTDPLPGFARSPALRLSPTAWAKLLFLRDAGETEVGGFGISAADDPLYVESVQLVRQTCDVASMAFDYASVADYFDRQVDAGRTPSAWAGSGCTLIRVAALAGTVKMLARDDDPSSAQRAVPADCNVGDTVQATPRRRARLQVDGGADVKAAANTAADPNRFAGLDDRWFWEDVFQISEKVWPFQEMAIEVALQRQAEEKTQEELAEMFGVTVPTIRKGLDYAAEIDKRFRDLPRKMARSRWHEDHALEVAAKKKDEDLGTKELVAFFKKSDTTIRAALDHARKLSGEASQADDAA